jgi:hypothetical protein
MRPATLVRTMVLAGAVLGLAACGDEDDLTGSYTGTARATASGITLTVPLRVTLSQSGSSLSGTFEATNPDGSTGRGNVSGTVNGSSVSMTFTPTTAGGCPAQLMGTHDTMRISGTLSIMCPGQAAVPGTFEITRQ